MPERLSLKHVGAALLVVVGVGASSPAMAGFQWVAPSDAVSAPPMGDAQQPVIIQSNPSVSTSGASSAAASAAPEVISPVVITAPVATTPAAPAGVAGQAPAPLMAPAESAKTQPQPAKDKDDSLVVGFAKSVPLAVALRQILPTGYAFSVDQDVDMGTLVSFRGGQGWRETLNAALDPVGLVARQHGQMVTVSSAGHMAMPSAEVVAPASAVRVSPVADGTLFQPGQEPKVMTLSQGSAPVAAVANPPAVAPLVIMDAPMANAGASPGSVTETWSAERGENLRKVLESWAKRANVEFDWLSEYDYPLEASVSFSGNFEMAVRGLLTGFEGAHPQPVAELHSNSNLGQMVLVVQTRGNTNSD